MLSIPIVCTLPHCSPHCIRQPDMSAFIIETALDTKVPHEIHLLGPGSETGQQQVSGKVNLVVFKPMQLKQLYVSFVAEVTVDYATIAVVTRSDPAPIFTVEFHAIDTPTQYKPGNYSYPFTLSLPSDLPATDSAKLKDTSLSWKYAIRTCAFPTSLFIRRKIVHQEIKLKRFHAVPSDGARMRCSGKREGAFECSLDGPKFVPFGDHNVRINAFLHPLSDKYKVKDLEVSITQTEVVRFTSKVVEESLKSLRNLFPNQGDEHLRYEKNKDASAPLVNTNNTKPVSKVAKISHPDQEEFSTFWGREYPVEFDIQLLPSEFQPTESVGWLQIKHGVRITVNFVDPAVKSFSVIAPLQIGHTLDEEMWIFQEPAEHDIHPPDYGVDVGHSILLDSNTNRMTPAQLHFDLYPEREPVVPDMTDSLPPMYENDGDQPASYPAEK